MPLVPKGNFFDIERVFDELWHPGLKTETAESGFFAPRVDIIERDDHYEISAELPGVDKKDVHVTLEDGTLSITAEVNKEEKEEKEGRLIRQERRYGKFMRSFTLSNNIKDGDISASYDNGVLKLSVPKTTEETPQRRRIEIG